MGKICLVDLSTGKIDTEMPGETFYRSYIGGEGIGVRLMMERQKPLVDALGPDNSLCFSAGLLTGCGVSSAARTTVVTKSPLTGTLGDANSGGYSKPLTVATDNPCKSLS